MSKFGTARDWAQTTVEVLYRIPGFPSIMQTFIWQIYDNHPDFPAVKKFLEFWEHELTDAPIVGVRINHLDLVSATQIRSIGADSVFRLH